MSSGVVLLVAAGAAMVSAAVEALSRDPDVPVLLLTAALAGAVGAGLLRFFRLPANLPPARMMTAAVVAGVAAVAVTALPYLAVDAVDGLDAALFEATAGVTTTAATTLTDPSELGRGMLLWRALSQWLGGVGLLFMILTVLPLLGTGGSDIDGGVVTRSARRIAPRMRVALRRLGLIYLAVTAALGAAYAAAGMGAFDAVHHALTTASAGGFSTRPGSLAGFDSFWIEAVAVVGMLVAGLSYPLIWRATMGREPTALLRSVELKVYLGLVAITIVLVWWWSGHDGVGGLGDAVVAATSAVSTTGFVDAPWTAFGEGSEALLLLATGIGGMTASMAGGFRITRVLAVFAFVRRELIRQLHPEVRAPVRIGRSVLGDEMSNRMIGSVSLSLALLVGATLILTSYDPAPDAATAILDGVSIGLTSLAGSGPTVVADATLTWPAGLGAVSRLTAVVVMLMGRLESYPVLIAMGMVSERLVRLVPVRRRRSRLER